MALISNGETGSSVRGTLNGLFTEKIYLASKNGIVGDNSTDNCVALQAVLDAIAREAVNATIIFDGPGPYLFSGALQDGSRRNAQILFPSVAITEQQYTITLVGGSGCPAFNPQPETSDVPLPSCTILRSSLNTASGTTPAMFGGKGPVSGPNFETSYVILRFKDIFFEMPDNPQLSCLNLESFTSTSFLGNCGIWAGDSQGLPDITEPSTSTSYALIHPHSSAGVYQKIEGALFIMGFYNAFKVGENAMVNHIAIFGCKNALVFRQSYGMAQINWFQCGWCQTFATWEAAAKVQILRWDTERRIVGSDWYNYIIDIADPSNYGIGELLFNSAVSNVGLVPGLFNRGLNTSLYIREQGVPPSLSANATAVFSDAFTDTDGTALSAHAPELGTWTASTAMEIESNKAIGTNSGSENTAFGEALGDATIQATVGVGASGVYVGIRFRYVDSSNYLEARINFLNDNSGTETWILIRTVLGVTDTTTTVQPGASGTSFVLKVIYSGTAIKLYRNGVLILSTTDVHFLTEATFGLFTFDAIATLDNLTVTDGGF